LFSRVVPISDVYRPGNEKIQIFPYCGKKIFFYNRKDNHNIGTYGPERIKK